MLHALLMTSLLWLFIQECLRIIIITHIIIILYLFDIFHLINVKKESTVIERENQGLPQERIDAEELESIINKVDKIKIDEIDENTKMSMKILRDKLNKYNLD